MRSGRYDSHPYDVHRLEYPQSADVSVSVCTQLSAEPVINHSDWRAGNLRWHWDALPVMRAWDRVVEREAALVGLAAALFATCSGLAAQVGSRGLGSLARRPLR